MRPWAQFEYFCGPICDRRPAQNRYRFAEHLKLGEARAVQRRFLVGTIVHALSLALVLVSAFPFLALFVAEKNHAFVGCAARLRICKLLPDGVRLRREEAQDGA